jgi:hypothetical protein
VSQDFSDSRTSIIDANAVDWILLSLKLYLGTIMSTEYSSKLIDLSVHIAGLK